MVQATARTPSVSVLVNGTVLGGIIGIEIDSNNHLGANRYSINAALDGDGYGVWLGDSFLIDIRIGMGGQSASLILGEVDRLGFDVGQGIVSVEGRDLTSRFIEALTQESFDNQTASEIATTLALRRGLIPAVAATDIIVGRSYQNDVSQTTLDQHTRSTTEWDLLVQLAEWIGYDVWVDGQTLNFVPPDQSANRLQLGPSDCISMNLTRILSLTNGIDVSVKSWDCRGQNSIVQTASSAAGSDNRSGYVVVRPNLNQAAAQMEAQRLLIQMCQHGRSVSIEMPGDVTTQPRDLLSISGSGTDFDGLWSISEVTRRISFDHGFTQTLQARIPAWTAF